MELHLEYQKENQEEIFFTIIRKRVFLDLRHVSCDLRYSQIEIMLMQV